MGDNDSTRLRFTKFLDNFSAPNTIDFVILLSKWVLRLHHVLLGLLVIGKTGQALWLLHLILLVLWSLIE